MIVEMELSSAGGHEKEPHNQNALSVWSRCVQKKGAEEAYKIIRREGYKN